MANMSAQALRTAVIQAVTTDGTFRTELAKDAAAAIQARFGEQTSRPRVVFEQERELSLVIPQKSATLAEAIERAAAQRGDRPPTRGEFESTLIAKAWNEPAYLAQLRTNATAAVNSALKAHGGAVPEGVTVQVYEEQPGECLIVVPRPAGNGAELSDAELEAVAGGEVGMIIAGAIVGAIASEVVGDILHPDSCVE